MASTGIEHHFLSLALVCHCGGVSRLGIRWPCCGTLGTAPRQRSASLGSTPLSCGQRNHSGT